MTLRSSLAVALLSASAATQTGPFAAGEILIQNPNGNDPQLLRVDPVSGQTEVLLDGFFWNGWADSLEYDTHRGGLLAVLSLPPDPYWLDRVWVIHDDGSAVAMPGLSDVGFSGLAPTGDGRVYFQRRTHGDTTIEYFDAGNELHVLMDETGLAPAAVDVEHMLYDAASNALIASANPSWSTGSCSGSENVLYRIPLSPDGSQLSDPISCNGVSPGSLNGMGLDFLPDGRVLVTYAGTNPFGFQIPEKLYAVDPVTLAATVWSNIAQADLNGGVYSDALGKAVVFEDHTNELRTWGFGQGGDGTLLPTSLPIGDGTTGFSPASNMTDINDLGPGCQGYASVHGSGLAGSGGRVPTLGAIGCPDLGQTFSVAFGQVVGGTSGVLFVGLGTVSVPFKGGTFYVGGLAFTLGLSPGGTAGVAGAGELNVPVVLTQPGLSGVEIVLQAGFADPLAVSGASLTNALRLKGF